MKKKLKLLDIYVIFSFILLLSYTVAEFITSSVTGISHDTLTTVFFAAFAGEVLSCALIKIFKLKEKDNEDIGDSGTDL